MKCPECSNPEVRLDFEKGENYCGDCGYVVEDLLPEVHKTLPEGRLAQSPSSITAGGLMQHGAIFKGPWALSSKQKNIYRAQKRIGFIHSNLSLPKHVYKEACRLYRQAIYKNLSVGRDNSSLVHACLYAACNLGGVPKTPKEIVENSSMKQKGMLRAYKLLKEELGLKINPADPSDYLFRYATGLDLSPKAVTKIAELIERIKKTNLFTGRHPESVIAAAIYIGCQLSDEPRSQREISGVVGVIEITIRKRYKEIAEALDIRISTP